jgi:hypothetical protein
MLPELMVNPLARVVTHGQREFSRVRHRGLPTAPTRGVPAAYVLTYPTKRPRNGRVIPCPRQGSNPDRRFLKGDVCLQTGAPSFIERLQERAYKTPNCPGGLASKRAPIMADTRQVDAKCRPICLAASATLDLPRIFVGRDFSNATILSERYLFCTKNPVGDR